MTKTEKFNLFKSTFTRYQKLFGLTGYKVYFEYEPIVDEFANITIRHIDMVATVRLNSKLTPENAPHEDVIRSAKHEALHLMLEHIEYIAEERYTTRKELYSASEEIVFKLENLIPDIEKGGGHDKGDDKHNNQ